LAGDGAVASVHELVGARGNNGGSVFRPERTKERQGEVRQVEGGVAWFPLFKQTRATPWRSMRAWASHAAAGACHRSTMTEFK
jgi:hypothetical protein